MLSFLWAGSTVQGWPDKSLPSTRHWCVPHKLTIRMSDPVSILSLEETELLLNWKDMWLFTPLGKETAEEIKALP